MESVFRGLVAQSHSIAKKSVHGFVVYHEEHPVRMRSNGTVCCVKFERNWAANGAGWRSRLQNTDRRPPLVYTRFRVAPTLRVFP